MARSMNVCSPGSTLITSAPVVPCTSFQSGSPSSFEYSYPDASVGLHVGPGERDSSRNGVGGKVRRGRWRTVRVPHGVTSFERLLLQTSFRRWPWLRRVGSSTSRRHLKPPGPQVICQVGEGSVALIPGIRHRRVPEPSPRRAWFEQLSLVHHDFRAVGLGERHDPVVDARGVTRRVDQ